VDWSALALVAFAAGTVGNSVKALPQFVRTALQGRVAGLSVTAVWLAFTANVLWLCFGLAIADWLFVGLGVVQTALTACTLVRFLALTGWSRNSRPALVALPACAAAGYLAATGSGLVLESLGAALGVIIGAPQLLYLWRRRRIPVDVSGVAQVEYVVVIVAQAGWTVYWLIQGHPVAAAAAAWGGTLRAVTFGLLRKQARHAHLVAP
jgi:uncharacterized protein with PQ loop repeat